MSQSVHNLMFQRLRKQGYKPDDAKAIIWIAKAASSCRPAKRWWTRELSTMAGEEMAIEQLWLNVSGLAAKYSVAFL